MERRPLLATLELDPDPGSVAHRAVEAALHRAGLRGLPVLSAFASRWRAQGFTEGVARGTSLAVGQARSPRSTRGATRA